jgi:molybdate transport system regulatory protein
MKTSARNQFVGTVSYVREGAVNAEVELELTGGQKIVAVITKDSAARLGLHSGKPAFALVKASSVILSIESKDVIFSARNNLNGTVIELHEGYVHAEVTMELTNGGTMAAVVTKQSAKSLDLKRGSPVSAIFKASSVILGVSA